VNKAGNMAPEYAFGGQEVQRSLLEAEGVTFNINGLINIAENLWKL
jgi:methylated-DNA-protein-cysteine methyltransferase related protein